VTSPLRVSTASGELDLSVLDDALKALLMTRVDMLESSWAAMKHSRTCAYVATSPVTPPSERVRFLELLQRACPVCPLVLPDGSRPPWAPALKSALTSLDSRAGLAVPPLVALGLLRATLEDCLGVTPELAPLEEQFRAVIAAQSAPYVAWAASDAGVESLLLESVFGTRRWSHRPHALRVSYTERPLDLRQAMAELPGADAKELASAALEASARPGGLLVLSRSASAIAELTDNLHLHYVLVMFARTRRTLVLPRSLEPLARRACAHHGTLTCAVLSDDTRADTALLETATALLEDSGSTLSAAQALRAARALV
jgi:hypothetical protein